MTLHRLAPVALFVACLGVAPSVAHGEAAVALSRGRDLVRSFEYDDAITQLEQVLADDGASASQRIEALELMGVLRINLDQSDAARQAFVRLLALDPGHQLAEGAYSPRVTELFGRVRGGTLPAPDVSLEVGPAAGPAPAGPLRIEGTLTGETGGVERVVAMVRTAGQMVYREVDLERSGRSCHGEVPWPPGGEGVELYAEARAPSGRVLARAGSESRPVIATPGEELEGDGSEAPPTGPSSEAEPPPVEAPIEDPQPDPVATGPRWYESWWFWTIVGVVVVGATATAVALTWPAGGQDGTLGRFTLE